MNATAQSMVLAGALLAAAGQILLKLGATGAESIADYLNLKLLLGFMLYGVGALFWVGALTKLPLTKVYPYTALTFVIVYAASFVILKEPMAPNIIFGAALVLLGLAVITLA